VRLHPFHLIVVHYHWRTGGVRSVVEGALPAVARLAGKSLRKITLLSGNPGDVQPWLSELPCETVFLSEPRCDYLAGQKEKPAAILSGIRSVLQNAAAGSGGLRTLVWLHNPALARNPLLVRGVSDFCKANGYALILHHHDFWCDGRWARWRDLLRSGCRTPAEAASNIFAEGSGALQVCINSRDRRRLGGPAALLPNPLPIKRAAPSAKKWLEARVPRGAPLWIAPTRFLRRKNLAEAVLLARWLRPEAVLATTSASCSPEEAVFAKRIRQAAREGRWNVKFGLLDGFGSPAVASILGAAEAVLLTSVQEGFGMAFTESAAAGAPLIGRALPSVLPDLRRMGFRFPHLYRAILVPPELFDFPAENRRRRALFEKVRKSLPVPLRGRLQPFELEAGEPVDFARLTHAGQLEVLRCDPVDAWNACKGLNPALRRIEGAVRSGNLLAAAPPPAEKNSQREYARKLLEIAEAAFRKSRRRFDARAAQERLLADALGPGSVFPILLEP
jgi:hypothetical protein